MAKRLRRHQSIPREHSPTKPCPNPKCRYKLYLTDHECSRCGTIIKREERTPDNLHCPHCREFIPTNSKACPKCGKQVYKLPLTPKSSPTKLPPDNWRIPLSPTKKVSVLPKNEVPAASPSPPASDLSSSTSDSIQAQFPTSPPSNQNSITWLDAFKISIAVAVAPFIHALLANISETVQPYWTHFSTVLVNEGREVICTVGLFSSNCP